MRVEERFRCRLQRHLRGVLADWRSWAMAHQKGMEAAAKIQQAWFEHVRRCYLFFLPCTKPSR